MPPVVALITGALSCLDIILITTLFLTTANYNKGAQLQLGMINVLSIAVVLPLIIQIIIAIVDYVIMRNLLDSIRRADHAEEIIALQTEIAAYEQERLYEKEQLEEGFSRIADTHELNHNIGNRTRIPYRLPNALPSMLPDRFKHFYTVSGCRY